MRVLLAGCGYVATEAGLLLRRQGAEVVALRRQVGVLPPSFVRYAADLTDPGSLEGLPSPFDAVIYSASPDSSDASAYESAYLRGLETLVEVLRARRDPIQRFVLLTSTGVYGQRDGGWVDETSPTAPQAASGRILVEAEQYLAAADVPGVSLRLGGIYGPGRTSFIDRVRDGRARMPGQAKYGNRIHRDDAARAAVHLLTHPSSEPVYNGVDEDPADLREVYRFLAELLGVPEPPPAEEGVDTTLRSARSHKRVRSEQLRSSGFRFLYPSFREGYRALVY